MRFTKKMFVGTTFTLVTILGSVAFAMNQGTSPKTIQHEVVSDSNSDANESSDTDKTPKDPHATVAPAEQTTNNSPPSQSSSSSQVNVQVPDHCDKSIKQDDDDADSDSSVDVSINCSTDTTASSSSRTSISSSSRQSVSSGSVSNGGQSGSARASNNTSIRINQ